MDHLVPNIGSIRERLSAARSLTSNLRSANLHGWRSLLYAFETLITTSCRRAQDSSAGTALGAHSSSPATNVAPCGGKRHDGDGAERRQLLNTFLAVVPSITKLPISGAVD